MIGITLAGDEPALVPLAGFDPASLLGFGDDSEEKRAQQSAMMAGATGNQGLTMMALMDQQKAQKASNRKKNFNRNAQTAGTVAAGVGAGILGGMFGGTVVDAVKGFVSPGAESAAQSGGESVRQATPQSSSTGVLSRVSGAASGMVNAAFQPSDNVSQKTEPKKSDNTMLYIGIAAVALYAISRKKGRR